MKLKAPRSCDACGQGHLTSQEKIQSQKYKGFTGQIKSHFSTCDFCYAELTNSEESKLNRREMIAFQKSAEQLLTSHEVKELRIKYGISQSQAATIFGGGPVAFSKYENDDVVQSEAMDKLLRVALNFPSVFSWLAERANETAVATSSMQLALSQLQKILDRKNTPTIHKRDYIVTPIIKFSASPHDSFVAANDTYGEAYAALG